MVCTTMFGQNADEVFGKNRLQYKDFDWKSIVSENFEVFYYDEGATLSREILKYLEANFDHITDLMGYPPYAKTKIFIYNSITDLQQSNVGINYNGPISGGETKFIKSHIEIAHPGTIAGFKKELLFKVTKLLLDEMLYGGSLKDMLQSNFMNLPEWLVEGAALYISQGWTIEMDDFAREIIRTEKNIKLTKYSGERAALLGQSVWNFIAERYGKSNISSILNYIKIIRNEERSVAITLGIPFNELLMDWKVFYTEMDMELDKSYVVPPEEERFVSKNRRGYYYKNVKFSPDGMKVAYSRNDLGHYNLIIYDIATDEKVVVMSGGNKVINQDVNYNLPLMNWVDDNTLGIIDVRKGKYIFWLYDVVSRSRIPRELKFFTEVNSLAFSQNGRLGIISGTFNGMSDLFLISTRRDRVNRLTNDIYDDIDASFVPNSNTIVFSSNRLTDTLNVKSRDFNNISENYNLFFYNLDTTENVLFRLTNTYSMDFAPTALDHKTIIYLSDQKGIQNLFKYDISTGIYHQLTNYKRNIKEYHYNKDTQSLMFVTLEDAHDVIYYIKQIDIKEQNFTPPSPMQQSKQIKIVRKRSQAKPENKEMSMSDIINSRLKTLETEPDTIKVNTQNQNEVLNTEDYVFEDEPEKPGTGNTFLSQYRSMNTVQNMTGPYEYNSLFSADKVIMSIVGIDPIRGFGLKAETSMNDLLENHHFGGGIITTTDLKSGNVWGFYQYYKEFLDYGVRYDRKNIYWEKLGDQNTLDKYNMNELTFNVSYPIDVRNRVSIKPILMNTNYYDLGTLDPGGIPTSPTVAPAIRNYYAGFNVEYVYDNSLILGMNIKEGTRAKVKLQHFEHFGNRNLSFSNIFAEVRHYQKIHREFNLALRLMYGSFFGKDPKQYALGNMDNSLLINVNQSGMDNPMNQDIPGNRSDILFTEFIGPIRGYDYSSLYGNSVLIFNAELRLPIMKYLNTGYISSNFFRNIQFIGFYDFGSSWTGLSFLNPSNTISTRTIPDDPFSTSPFEITLRNYSNPWISSYGFGFRTMMLGYYSKFDLAWPIENNSTSKPRLSITIGFDF